MSNRPVGRRGARRGGTPFSSRTRYLPWRTKSNALGRRAQPQRTRSWRTAHLDSRSQERAEKLLGCHAWAERSARRSVWVVCTDELPNRQVLERRPRRRAIPGALAQRECESTRHGTVNILTFLSVHTGRREAVRLESHEATHHVHAPRYFRRADRRLKGMDRIHDGGPSHSAALTSDSFAARPEWWRPRLTPAHASWRNPGEWHNHAYDGRHRKRGSWSRRGKDIAHVASSWPEDQVRDAHPFDGTGTNPKRRRWFAEHAW